MIENLLNWPDLQNYVAYALTLSAGFYGIILFFSDHLSKASKENLSLWLLGAYEGTWASHFCRLFDAIFDERHLSWRCFCRSTLASLLAVVSLWFLVDPVLGLIDQRTTGSLDIWQAVILGAAINVVPDYLSLLETRWLLQRFKAVRTIWGQILVLIADLIFTGLIIWGAIALFLLSQEEKPISIVEMLALFSIYSIFYYSTFLTSVWAWIYCISTWFMRLFSRTGLSNILAVEEKPGKQIALVSATLLFFAMISLAPMLQSDTSGQVSWVDSQLCTWFPDDACPHVVRLSEDEKLAISYFERICENIYFEDCLIRINKYSGGVSEKSVQLFKIACVSGLAKGCTNLGWMTVNGQGLPKSDAKAAVLYRTACDKGDGRGCTNLGWMTMNGRGVPTNDVKAAALHRAACDSGDMKGCTSLGWMFAGGRGVTKDDAKAAELYQTACNGGDAEGCTSFGLILVERQDDIRDDERAVTLFRKACDSNHARGCTSLGLMLAEGQGITRDDERAVTLFRKACDSNHARGCTSLGLMLAEGRGITRDDERAVTLFRKACDSNHARGCTGLGWMFAEGRGVTKDNLKAAAFYRTACDGGDGKGCTSLGLMFAEGRGVTKDNLKAAAFYRTACDGGDGKGCTSLGLMFAEGRSIKRDGEQAKSLFEKACANGHRQGCLLRDSGNTKLSKFP